MIGKYDLYAFSIEVEERRTDYRILGLSQSATPHDSSVWVTEAS